MSMPSLFSRLHGLLMAGLGLGALACGQQATETGEPAAPALTAEQAEFETLLGQLTAPLRPELVRAVLHHPLVREIDAAKGLASHLTVQRGVAAAQGLCELAGHPSADVCLVALRGVATLGLRVAGAADAARLALRFHEGQARLGAIAALGVVGEARDVEELLELLEGEDKHAQIAAFRALRTMTGIHHANDIRLWRYWWKQTARELPKRLEQALAVLAAGGSDADCAEARRLLGASAWFDLPKLEEAAREWLASSEPRQRVEGYHLVTAAKLGALAEEVAMGLNNETEVEAIAAGIACATALGIRSTHLAEIVPSAPTGR